MNTNHLKIIYLLGFCISNAYANPVQEYYCAKNYQMVRLGDTIAQVQTACGEPQEVSAGKQEVQKTAPITQWFYQVNNVALNGTAYITNVFSFREGKVIKIQVEGQEVNSTTICDGSTMISVGDSEDTINSVCGDPTFINQGTVVESRKNEETVVWSYSNPSIGAQVTFQFNKGILVSIDSGS